MNQTVIADPTIAPGPAQAARIQAAIDEVHASGGGRVTVGPGSYRTTTICLRSGVELHLAHGARLEAHHELTDYPEMPRAAANKDQTLFHLIAAFDCRDAAITGSGVLDGQDAAFWVDCERREDRPYGIFRYLVKGDHETGRPSPMVQLVRCRGLRLADFTVQSMPGWGLHIFDCEQVSVSGLTVRGHPYGPNTDGIGVNGSRDVRIAHCDVDTGDDAIIIKATNPDQRCERVTVTNCVLASNCAALGLGSDVEGVVRDVVFTNCVVKRSLRMIQVEMWFPGQVERAVFSGITGCTLPDEEVENERPIYVDIQQFIRPEPTLGAVRQLVFRDILCESRGRILLTAQDGAVIEDVTLDNIRITVPEVEDPQVTVPRATSLQLSNHSPETRAARAAVVADNVDRLFLRNVSYGWPGANEVPMHGLCLRRVEGLVDESPNLTASHPKLERILTPGQETRHER
ncbi:MAG: glycoside hydrolase family 28 protein [Planctomycetota bacterium]|jgi:hypothetical protein